MLARQDAHQAALRKLEANRCCPANGCPGMGARCLGKVAQAVGFVPISGLSTPLSNVFGDGRIPISAHGSLRERAYRDGEQRERQGSTRQSRHEAVRIAEGCSAPRDPRDESRRRAHGHSPFGDYALMKPRYGLEPKLAKFGKTVRIWLSERPNHCASVPAYCSTEVVGMRRPAPTSFA